MVSFDPTWAAGYIDQGQSVRTILITGKPEEMIKSHMPYDYVWQFYHIHNQYWSSLLEQTFQNLENMLITTKR
jgi:hypothetical protein